MTAEHVLVNIRQGIGPVALAAKKGKLMELEKRSKTVGPWMMETRSPSKDSIWQTARKEKPLRLEVWPQNQLLGEKHKEHM